QELRFGSIRPERDLLSRLTYAPPDPELRTLGKRHIASICRAQDRRLDVVEVDALQRLRDVEGARPSLVIHTAPVVDAIRRVRVLLDLENEVAAVDGVNAAARNE